MGFDGVAGSRRMTGPPSGCSATTGRHPDSGTGHPEATGFADLFGNQFWGMLPIPT